MKLRAGPSALPSSTSVVARVLMAVAAAVTAFWLLAEFVDVLHPSMRHGEALRELRRSSAPLAEVTPR